MTQRAARRLAALVAVLLAAGALAACGSGDAEPLPYYADADFTPQWVEGSVPDTFHTVPPFALTSHRGTPLTEAALDGQITVANFFFASCPGICPMTMGHMKRVQDATAGDADVRLVSHSVTPERDSVAVLAAYADGLGVADRWHLATGARAAMYRLGRLGYFADDDLGEPAAAGSGRSADTFLHTETLYLLDPDRHIRGVYNGLNATSVDQLVADIQALRRSLG